MWKSGRKKIESLEARRLRLRLKIVNEKLAVFTFDDVINEPGFRRYFIKNWKAMTVGMQSSTILFMAGIHGTESGEFGEPENIQTLKNQVGIKSFKLNRSIQLISLILV